MFHQTNPNFKPFFFLLLRCEWQKMIVVVSRCSKRWARERWKAADHRLNLDTHACRYYVWYGDLCHLFCIYICLFVCGWIVFFSSCCWCRLLICASENEEREKNIHEKKLFINVLIDCVRRFEFRVLFVVNLAEKQSHYSKARRANARKIIYNKHFRHFLGPVEWDPHLQCKMHLQSSDDCVLTHDKNIHVSHFPIKWSNRWSERFSFS